MLTQRHDSRDWKRGLPSLTSVKTGSRVSLNSCTRGWEDFAVSVKSHKKRLRMTWTEGNFPIFSRLRKPHRHWDQVDVRLMFKGSPAKVDSGTQHRCRYVRYCRVTVASSEVSCAPFICNHLIMTCLRRWKPFNTHEKFWRMMKS